MAVNFKPWETPTEYGVHYRFDKAGEGIPMHSHVNPAMMHSTRCIKGSIEIYGDVEPQTLAAGETATFKSYRLHEVVALTDGAELVNVFHLGKPKDYEGVPIETLSGCTAPVLMGKVEFQ